MSMGLLIEYAQNQYRYQRHVVECCNMEPTIKPGDLIIYDIMEDRPRDGGIYLFRFPPIGPIEATDAIYRIHALGSRLYRLISDHPSMPWNDVSREQLDQMLCLGRCIYHFKRV
jgi:hypothetical protein